jgi:site-specific DNA-methyltransferase (adenine-specific)
VTDWKVHHGDCLEVLRTMPDASVDAVVTDPPYGLSFMGKRWDYDVPSEEIWRECLRVLKPGGHLLAFAGTRTQHRMAVRIEDAGFEIRDMIAWVYGSGFPKSLDVSKAIDKAAGAEREVIGNKFDRPGYHLHGHDGGEAFGHGIASTTPETRLKAATITAPATPEAQQWAGWGTALKPALEPITVARKPLVGTVAANVLEHGTGALNVDGCRVAGAVPRTTQGQAASAGTIYGSDQRDLRGFEPNAAGRWPANLIHDGSDEVVGLFPVTKSTQSMRGERGGNIYGNGKGPSGPDTLRGHTDTGSAARFFYCAKASKADRDEGCEGIAERLTMRYGEKAQGPLPQQTPSKPVPQRNHHPTVKPTDLMRYLCRLVTPPGGLVLDPFTGSGSTGKAAILEGFRFVGIEREAEYVEIARARIAAAEPDQLSLM